jgi:hypothetical protein
MEGELGVWLRGSPTLPDPAVADPTGLGPPTALGGETGAPLTMESSESAIVTEEGGRELRERHGGPGGGDVGLARVDVPRPPKRRFQKRKKKAGVLLDQSIGSSRGVDARSKATILACKGQVPLAQWS